MSSKPPPVDPRFAQPGHPPATITEFDGVRSLHLGTSWEQGAMRLSRPDAIELEYVQMMMAWLLFLPAPRRVCEKFLHGGVASSRRTSVLSSTQRLAPEVFSHPLRIVQLGLGSAALTKFCYRRLPGAQVTAVELNPNVIAICRALFELPPDDARLDVREMNALDYVLDPAHHGRADVLQVDLYDEQARGPVLDSPEFYQGCYDCLAADGIMTANVFGETGNYDKNLAAMTDVFDAVVWLPEVHDANIVVVWLPEVHDANIVVIAFKRAPQLDFSTLYERAGEIRRRLNLPARDWVDGLKEWMHDQQE